MNQKRWVSPTLLGVCHFLVDFVCAVALFGNTPASLAGLCFILYNGLAFAFQLPLGALADCFDLRRSASIAGCVLVALGALLPHSVALAAVIGLGNALFHIGGGREVLIFGGNKFAAVGRFVAPGALGIFLGPKVAMYSVVGYIGAALLIALSVLLYFIPKMRAAEVSPAAAPAKYKLIAAACFFLTVLLRSYMGTALGYGFGSWLAFAFTFCVFAGKFFGGSLADRFGALKLTSTAQPLGVVLFVLSVWQPVLALPAIFIFNTTMAITAARLSQLFPKLKGTMFGLTTFALFAGVLPKLLGAANPFFTPWGLGGISSISALLLILGLWAAERKSERD